jgi:hypothetical protein
MIGGVPIIVDLIKLIIVLIMMIMMIASIVPIKLVILNMLTGWGVFFNLNMRVVPDDRG